MVFAPPAGEAAGLLSLPWATPLERWDEPRLIVARNTGLHRHVVRFIADGGRLWAVKELPERLARREYALLRHLAAVGIPAVVPQGVVVDRGDGLDAALVTRFLEYSTTYRALFSEPRGLHPADVLLDAMVELLARLHLAGFYWGDCSLSNTLFRLDAGALVAHLVDAETAELHPSLSDGQRRTDVDGARERVVGELLDLAAGGLLREQLDPFTVGDELLRRYEQLWDELTGDWAVAAGEEQQRLRERIDRLNQLGFDVEEIELVSSDDVTRLRITTKVSETGRNRAELYRRTGLIAQENQARRLLNDLAAYKAYLERDDRALSDAVAAHRWLDEVYDPVVSTIPMSLVDKLDPVEVFHEVLEHRWFLSERAGADVGTGAAAESYFREVLPAVPDSLTSGTTAPPEL
ncbi:MAG: DUF4032 domain-containing protein [Acidimicrobiales bacterium]